MVTARKKPVRIRNKSPHDIEIEYETKADGRSKMLGTVSLPAPGSAMPEASLWLDGGHIVTIVWTTLNGRLEPHKVTVQAPEGRPVTAEALRSIPLGTIVTELRTRVAAAHERRSRTSTSSEERARWLKVASQAGGALEPVAEIYREAHRAGLSPIEEVATALGVSKSTAAKRVVAARRAGHLGPAVPGKAGEA